MALQTVLKFLAWLALILTLFITVSPIEFRPQSIPPVNIERGGAFALISAMFIAAYPKLWKLCTLLLITGVIGLELMQLLSETRHARISDVAVKILGTIIGVAVGWFISFWLSQRQK